MYTVATVVFTGTQAGLPKYTSLQGVVYVPFYCPPFFPGIGRPPEVTTKTQKLKATVCLAENFPLDLQEQIMPIIDLMVGAGCIDVL